MFNERILRDMAFFCVNVDRSELETAGIIPTGPDGDTAWKCFNSSLDAFLIKLTPEKRTAFADMLNAHFDIKHRASFIPATGVNPNPSHAARMESRRVSV